MTQDKLLELVFCDPEGWQDAISRAADKDINQRDLRELCTPEWRMAIAKMIKDGTYNVVPPHQIDIPKDEYDENGQMKYRHVYCNEPKDRVLFIRIYQVLAHECTEHVHPSCKSYQHGISCGDSVKEFMQTVSAMPTVQSVIGTSYTDVIGWKSDLSKYFDSVPLQYIDEAFDMVESKFGHSAIIDLLRRYYHSDWYFDTEGNLCQEYKSMKQGCAVAAWLANVILYHIDERLSHMAGRYMRYSDDILFVGPDSTLAFATLKSELLKMEMTLNRKKVDDVRRSSAIKFLGFAIRPADKMISVSPSTVQKLQAEVMKAVRPYKNSKGEWKKPTYKQALREVLTILYNPRGEFSWATRILRTINNVHDLAVIDTWIKDALRATLTNRYKIGGIGFSAALTEGCLVRGTGRNVTANRRKTPARLEGYYSLPMMRKCLLTSHAVYDSYVREM